MKSNYKKIGDFIELVDKRNKDLAIELLLGLSVTKDFIPSVANTIGTNMKTYKIIKQKQFAYGPVTSRNAFISCFLLSHYMFIFNNYSLYSILILYKKHPYIYKY